MPMSNHMTSAPTVTLSAVIDGLTSRDGLVSRAAPRDRSVLAVLPIHFAEAAGDEVAIVAMMERLPGATAAVGVVLRVVLDPSQLLGFSLVIDSTHPVPADAVPAALDLAGWGSRD